MARIAMWVLAIFVSIISVSGYAMGTLGKAACCVALAVAFGEAPPDIPSWAEGRLNESRKLYEQFRTVSGILASVDDLRSGSQEKSLIMASDDEYPAAYQRYLQNIITVQNTFNKDWPFSYHANLREWFDFVYCAETVESEVRSFVEHCDASDWCSHECRSRENWKYAIPLFDELKVYPCGAVLPPIRPNDEEVNVQWRLTDMSELKPSSTEPRALLSDYACLFDLIFDGSFDEIPMYDAVDLNGFFWVRVALGESVKRYNEQEIEQALLNKSDKAYALALSQHAFFATIDHRSHQKYFDKRYPKRYVAFFYKVCCNRDVMDALRGSLRRCTSPNNSNERCLEEEMNQWRSAIYLCDDTLLKRYKCHESMPSLVPREMLPTLRFKGTKPMGQQESASEK